MAHFGIDAKRIFFNHSGLGNYSRRFYQALANNFADDSFFLYSPKPVPENNPYLKEILAINSTIKTPDSSLHRMMGGIFWRSGLVHDQLIKDHIDVYYGLSNEIPFGIQKMDLKKVVVIHDLIFLRYPELYPGMDVFFYKMKTKYACKHSDYIITASEQTKKDVIDFYGVDPAKITVLYPCSDSKFYNPVVEDSSSFFNKEKDYVISIGAITPRKNLMKTIQAMQIVNVRHDLDLVVIGTATGLGRKYLETIREFINRNNMTDRVHFLDNVPYKYVPDLCRKAKLLVYPSQFEGFGMPIVEGLFSKIPVITSEGGVFPEAAGDGALYIDPEFPEQIAEAMEKILGSVELKNEMVNKGWQFAQRFTQEHIENEILTFHHSIVGKKAIP